MLQGTLDLPLLVACYLVESMLLTLRRPRSVRDEDRWGSLRDRLLMSLLLLVVGSTAVSAVRWDGTALLVLASTVLLFVLGQRAAERTGVPSSGHFLLTWGWQLAALLVGSVVAVPYVRNIGELRDAGWEPAALGDYLLDRVGIRVNTWLLESGLEPAVLGTAIFVLFKTVNELVMPARRAAAETAERSAA